MPEDPGSPTTTNEAVSTVPVTAREVQREAAPNEDDWRRALPPELQKAAGKFNSPVEVLKSYVALERRLGRAIVLPGDDAGPEEIRQFNRRLGVPAEPEGYRIDLPARLARHGSETGEPSALQQRFVAAMHAAGARPAAVQAAVTWYADEIEAIAQERAAACHRAVADGAAELRREWGFDFERNLTLAERVLRRFCADEAEGLASLELQDGQALGDHAGFLHLLARIGAALAEDQVLVGDVPVSPGNLEDRINELHALSPATYKSAAVQAELGSLYRAVHGAEDGGSG